MNNKSNTFDDDEGTFETVYKLDVELSVEASEYLLKKAKETITDNEMDDLLLSWIGLKIIEEAVKPTPAGG